MIFLDGLRGIETGQAESLSHLMNVGRIGFGCVDGVSMLTTFAFDVCHQVYCAAREVIDNRISTLNAESAGEYLWKPDRLPRMAEYVCDFELAGERALGAARTHSPAAERALGAGRAESLAGVENCFAGVDAGIDGDGVACGGTRAGAKAGFLGGHGARAEACARAQASACAGRRMPASRAVLFRIYYLGGAEYRAARRHLGISELTWADWTEEIRRAVGKELMGAGMFPPSGYFR